MNELEHLIELVNLYNIENGTCFQIQFGNSVKIVFIYDSDSKEWISKEPKSIYDLLVLLRSMTTDVVHLADVRLIRKGNEYGLKINGTIDYSIPTEIIRSLFKENGGS